VSNLAFEFGELHELVELAEERPDYDHRAFRLVERVSERLALVLYEKARVLGVDPGDVPEIYEAAHHQSLAEQLGVASEWLHARAGDVRCAHSDANPEDYEELDCPRCRGTYWHRPLEAQADVR
jgi:hypothetical protein